MLITVSPSLRLPRRVIASCSACLLSISKYLQIPVNDILLVQILNCEEDFSRIEFGTFLWKPVDNITQAMHSNVRLCHTVPPWQTW